MGEPDKEAQSSMPTTVMLVASIYREFSQILVESSQGPSERGALTSLSILDTMATLLTAHRAPPRCCHVLSVKCPHKGSFVSTFVSRLLVMVLKTRIFRR